MSKAALAKIHLARKQLNLDEDAYRSVIQRVTGQQSCKGLTDAQLGRVIEEFGRLGFKSKSSTPSERPAAAKIRALWIELAERGIVQDRSDKALYAFVKRQAGVDRLDWLEAAAAASVIEALKSWLARKSTGVSA